MTVDACPDIPGVQIIVGPGVFVRPMPGVEVLREECPSPDPFPGPTVVGYGGASSHADPDLVGNLPFTGLDVALLVFVAFGLLVLGTLLRGVRRG